MNPLKDESGPYRFDGETPLNIALKLGDERKLEILLNAGASITAENIIWSLKESDRGRFRDLFFSHLPRFEAGDEKASEALELVAKQGGDILPLVEKGATPSREWRKSFFKGASGKGLQLLNEKYLYPELMSGEKITLFQPRWKNFKFLSTVLAEKSKSPQVPSMVDLLMSQPPGLWLENVNGVEQELPTKWRIWRKNAEGQLETISVDVASEEALPELRWVDLLEIRTIEPISQSKPSKPRETTRAKSFLLSWHLRRRVTFPITLTVGENTREITLRGDRLVYDPTLPEAPLLDAWKLISLMTADDERITKSLKIQRSGMQDVILKRGGQQDPVFELQAHDHLIMAELGPDQWELKNRLKYIRAYIPGIAGNVFLDFVPESELAPTLVEFLAAVYSSSAWFEEKEFLSDEDAVIADLTAWAQESGGLPRILPHPDFSSIQIRRVDQEGEETLLKVNLANAIQSCSEDTSADEARKYDVELQPGDIVQFSLMPKPEAWTGFSKAQNLFFGKVLSGSFQKTDEEGVVSVQTLNWAPINYTPSVVGLLPLIPNKGDVSMNMRSVLGIDGALNLTRGGKDYENVKYLQLRDGDQIQLLSEPAGGGGVDPEPSKK